MRIIKHIKFSIAASALLLSGCSQPSISNSDKKVIDSALNASTDQQLKKSMEEFKNRPIYKKLTVLTIDTTKDDELLQVVLDNLYEKYPEDYTKEYETVLQWSEARQAIYFVSGLEGEVNNGGFNQYYYNSTGQFAQFAPDALKLIGASKYADLATRANKIYKIENAKITKHQDGTLEGFSKSYKDNPLDGLDTEFYNLEKKEDLQKLQVDFIRKHKSDFIDN